MSLEDRPQQRASEKPGHVAQTCEVAGKSCIEKIQLRRLDDSLAEILEVRFDQRDDARRFENERGLAGLPAAGDEKSWALPCQVSYVRRYFSFNPQA
jgi:hypothetical protein